jgi:DNA-binding NarL/FixJ family response regulator
MEECEFEKILNQLTEPRHKEQVLRLFLEGNSDSQIAQILCIDRVMIKTNVSNTRKRFCLSGGNNNPSC